MEDSWAIGVDLGGTKLEVGQVDVHGKLRRRLRRPTGASRGPASIKAEVIAAVQDLLGDEFSPPAAGVGVGVAGQVDPRSGAVRFSPNLGWRDEPFGEDLRRALGVPVVVTNDVRAATWGEWLHGAGKGIDDLVCLFVGTGIGGGVVSGGRVLVGCTNTAGELGHLAVALQGPPCRCGNRGCLEALAGGWAIAQRAQERIAADPAAGSFLLTKAEGRLEEVSAAVVAQGQEAGDPLARQIIDEAVEALVAGMVSLVNAFNPCRFILGGGVIEGLPELIPRIRREVIQRSPAAAGERLEVLAARLGHDAGVVGAASLVLRAEERTFGPEGKALP